MRRFVDALGAKLFANRRLSLLKVQMQMIAMRIVGLWAKHCGEYSAAAVVREAQKLGFGRDARIFSGGRTWTGWD
jgi:hypothetical protein